MTFCPNCGSLLIPRDGRLKCECGYSQDGYLKFSEKIINKDIEIIDENLNYGDATVPIVCWNCGHTGVFVKVNFGRSDEAPLRIYKCEKCKKVWRSSK
jgi:DNA-directed RNA polymerase subunit M